MKGLLFKVDSLIPCFNEGNVNLKRKMILLISSMNKRRKKQLVQFAPSVGNKFHLSH